VNRVSKIFEARLNTAHLMIQSHRDDILIKVME